ncbi:MAG: sulfurtransferase [Gammaproteobacteria bacterium]|nr:sulfurtransferase [Gammaproteobacteria bacterium]
MLVLGGLLFAVITTASLAATDAKSPLPAAAVDTATAFPLRPQYIDVPVLDTAELDKKFADVFIVDVRSPYEYDTLRIKDAILIPLTDKNFVEEVRKLREKSATKPIVFYCNGKTCRKSYDAVLKAKAARISGTVCYDAGIAEWAEKQPDKAVLLGRTPIKAGELLSSAKFKAHLLDPKAFEAKVGPNSIVLDVRDRVQRDTQLFPFKEQRAQLEEKDKLDAIIEQAKRDKKTLLVYDAVGKQVEWFQYYLENKGLSDYFFMKGGAQGHFDVKYGKVSFGEKKKEAKAEHAAVPQKN